MGCTISSLELQQNGVLSSVPYNLPYNIIDLNDGQSVTFTCPNGYDLTDQFGALVPNNEYTVVCHDPNENYPDLTDQIDIVSCPGAPPFTKSPTASPTKAPTETPTPAPTKAPTQAPTAMPTNAPVSTSGPTASSNGADTRTTELTSSSLSYLDCIIPSMNGIVGYQGSTNEHQVEIPRFPLSFGEIVGDDGASSVSSYYFLEPNDTITFVCEDDTQMMKINDIPLEPHSVNFYTYTCSIEKSPGSTRYE